LARLLTQARPVIRTDLAPTAHVTHTFFRIFGQQTSTATATQGMQGVYSFRFVIAFKKGVLLNNPLVNISWWFLDR